MSVFYNGEHSITFIGNDYCARSWLDLHLIPEQSFSPALYSPSRLNLDLPFSSKSVDYTDKILGRGYIISGPMQGEWVFYVNHDNWTNCHETKKVLENNINGKNLRCVLEDDHDIVYNGRFQIKNWEDNNNYSKVTIGYNMNVYTTYNDIYYSLNHTADTIVDDWNTIIKNIRNGTYRTKYSIGDTKTVQFLDEVGPIQMQIAAFDADILSNTAAQTAAITWVAKDVLRVNKWMNTTRSSYVWGGNTLSRINSVVDSYLYDTIYGLKTPIEIKRFIKNVKKTCYTSTSTVTNSNNYMWIPSYREVMGGTSRENSGPIYSEIFPNITSRVRCRNYQSSLSIGRNWWLRSRIAGSNHTQFHIIGSSGLSDGSTNLYPDLSSGIVIGFCT